MIPDMTTRGHRLRMLALPPVIASCLAGCSTPSNQLWTVDGVSVAEAVDGGAPTADLSLGVSRGADRSRWNRTTIVVPVGTVAHQPTYATSPAGLIASPAPRHGGAFPTPESAVDVSGDAGDRALDALADPFVAAADIVLFPIRAVESPPWSEASSPAGFYERAPAPQP